MTVVTGQLDSRGTARQFGAGRTPTVLQIVLFSLVVAASLALVFQWV